MGSIQRMREDIDAILERDPAARTRLEVVLCYPGFHAVLIHRLARGAWTRRWYLVGRFLSHCGRLLTGIEIHPGARLGRRLFIDHGMGCVIGETAELGDDVTLYHDVTLGGISLEKGKRHPTLEDGVIVGAGAQLLGPITIGARARIGANAVVLADVAEGATMVGIPAKAIVPKPQPAEKMRFSAYGTPAEGMPDPVALRLEALTQEIEQLRQRLAALEAGEDTGDRAPRTGT